MDHSRAQKRIVRVRRDHDPIRKLEHSNNNEEEQKRVDELYPLRCRFDVVAREGGKGG
jgi:hypothetical protein